ncbi:hypothetical protein PR048_007099 [Dryococelus australis]|uniref:Uncharacterized protein n=1 Tax=Dryococelus australis TaxID=614101 RepID=A0ABQ9IDZ7_9NEOP|nr:hypothetical protein PR048_007099 [Dryococelus australis]
MSKRLPFQDLPVPRSRRKGEYLHSDIEVQTPTLEETHLPKYLRDEAICTAKYQINRSPSSAIQGRLPAEIYIGNNDYLRLKIFVCVCG